GLGMAVSRTGGQVDRFAFAAQEDFLRGQSVLIEPHSFDVSATAQYGGASYSWTYDSYEGRTTIARPVADAAGVVVEQAGPAIIEETATLQGVVELLPEGRAEIRAWYPGRIIAMRKFIGDSVQAGEIVARIEAAQSLQTYSITAPFSGFVVERHGTEGGVAGDEPLYVFMDPTKLHAELFVFPQNARRVRAGQEVEIRDLVGDANFHSEIEIVLSPSEIDTPMRVAHVEIPGDDERWWPGMAIEGEIVIGSEEVPLAVRTPALQRFRDFTVVYGRFGDTYEVRMLELGRQTPEWTEILGGLEPGTTYVTENAFLIRADVEKDGAVHDH
ncbi:MAG: efflux RND transporter periplasmic adaptor subunit, partial [Micropepsaceae bacterium]